MRCCSCPSASKLHSACKHLPLQTVLDRALEFEVLPERFEVVKEKKAKDFANMK